MDLLKCGDSWNLGDRFLSVGGVIGCIAILESDAIFWFSFMEACDVDIAACCTALRSCTRVARCTG